MKKEECRMQNGHKEWSGQRDLRERTEAFALRIVRMFARLPRNDTTAQVLGKQGLRSGTSVGANYREADRGRSKAEFISKMGDCLKELDETDYWLQLLVKGGLVPAARMQPLIDETNELIAIFVSILNRARKNQ